MSNEVVQILEVLARVLEMIGGGALVLGFIIATGQCIGRSVRAGVIPAVTRYRQSIGRVVLVGLELLVAATIIKTITFAPTAESMGLLAMMVAIRTILGWTVVLEMSGRWPWQKQPPEVAQSPTES